MRPYISKIGVLPTSLPHLHRAYMEARKDGKADEFLQPAVNSDISDSHPQSTAEQAETARRLKPHSRSQLRLDEASKKPEGMTPVVAAKKHRPTRWQFGIRSRNQPLEAIGCIYRALHKLGAEWVADGDWVKESGNHDNDADVEDDALDGGPLHHTDSIENNGSVKFISRKKAGRYELPDDPWVLHVRWKKDGMYPPGVYPPNSAHSSSHDLRRSSISSSSPSIASPTSSTSAQVASPTHMIPDESVVMHLDIQLYEMDQSVFLVDFKAAGYENAEGKMMEEKDVTSPFPFLDLASRLIIQLAESE